MTDDDIEALRIGVMYLVDALSRAEGWPIEKYEKVAYMIENQPWYATYADQTFFRECLCAASPSKGKSR